MPDEPEQAEQPQKPLSKPEIKASEAYYEAVKRLQDSMSFGKSSLVTDHWRKALEEARATTEIRESDLRKAVESLQNTYAPLRLRTEISALEEKARKQAEEMAKHSADKKKLAGEIDKLRGIIDELNNKQSIQHLLNSVTEEAHQRIEDDDEFRGQFDSESEVDAFVVSVDIRRSTELMLKARSPKLFADFITTLCRDLEGIFKDNWAVVDKFTGDGILCFFPIFFSGKDAGYFALRASKLANEAFARRYRQFRTSFTTVLNDVGLGIGIDYGKVHLVRMAGALTIVGQPVVYACRMGGAPAGHILLNQPAYEVIQGLYENLTLIDECLIKIKSEGDLIAYDVTLTNKEYRPSEPDWRNNQG